MERRRGKRRRRSKTGKADGIDKKLAEAVERERAGIERTADAIAAGVREKFGALSLQAIYGVVTACTEAGLLRRIEPAGHPARYERRVGDNHHHLVCRRCGRTEDVDCVAGERPCLDPDDEHGFTIDEAEVVFWGLCPACMAAGGSATGTQYHEEEWQ